MLRTVVCSVVVLFFLACGLVAEEKKKAAAEGKNLHRATLVKVDLVKKTVTFTTKDKAGKEKEMTLPLAKNAKIFGERNQDEALEKFAADLAKNKDKTIWIEEDKDERQIVDIREKARPNK